MSGTLRLLAGPAGLSAGPFPADLGVTLAIARTAPVTIALDKRLPAGPWDAQITMRSALVERTARATVTFPDIGAAPPVNTSAIRAPDRTRSLPILVALGAIGLLSMLLLVARRRRRAVKKRETAVSLRERSAS